MKERSSSTVFHRTVIGWLGAMLLASTALVLATPSTAVAMPPHIYPMLPSPDITVPLPAVLRVPLPAPAWLQPPATR